MLILFIIMQNVVYTEAGNVLISNIPPVESAGVGSSHEIICNDYDHIIKYYCQLYGIDQELVKIIIEKESEFNPNAVSASGAIGLMQLMPETAEVLGVKDAFNPRENIRGGIKFLRNLFDMFGGNLELTLAAYHAGPGIVKRLNRVPSIPETIEYVYYITSRYGAAVPNPIQFTLTEDGTPLFTNRPK
jgi:soluble lytic murein transglycosylase-like protein